MEVRKNILILMHNYATQFIDIANQYVKLFDPNQYKVTVAYLSGEPDDKARAKTLGEEVIFMDCSKKEIRGMKIKTIKKLIDFCHQENFYMVISHRYKPIYVMMWAAQFCKIPIIVFVMHAMQTVNHLSRRLLIAALARKNMYFAGVSDAVRDDLRGHIWCVPKERIVTLYNCIDVENAESKLLSRSDARKYLQLPENDFIIGTVGRLVPDKDQTCIIHAFAQIKSHLSDAKLLIVGDGTLEQDLKMLSEKLHLQDDVIFTGFVPDAQRYLKAFDLFVLSSVEEAFGRVLLEAMVAKVPVIGTRINGIPEVIGDAGFVVSARDANMLASAIQKVVSLPEKELHEIGNKGYDRIVKNFSTEKFKQDFWGNFLKTEPRL